MSDEVREVFVSYLDDDGEKKDVWVNSINIEDGFVTFTTLSNEFSIPTHRVIKIKKKIGGLKRETNNKNTMND